MTLVAVGRLTNLALALALEPRLPELVKEVVLMGGSASAGGNVTPVAEANVWGDPHAADIVFAAPWKVVMVGLDVTTRVRLEDDRLLRMARKDERVGGFVYRTSRFYKQFHDSTGVTGGFYVHDPSAVAYAIDPGLFSTETAAVRVVTEGIAIGQTIAASAARAERWEAVAREAQRDGLPRRGRRAAAAAVRGDDHSLSLLRGRRYQSPAVPGTARSSARAPVKFRNSAIASSLPPRESRVLRKWSPFSRVRPPWALIHSTLTASSTSLQK